jgi:hypothetical protein
VPARRLMVFECAGVADRHPCDAPCGTRARWVTADG